MLSDHCKHFIYTIRGIPVRFPFEAYECQVKLMERIIKALQMGENGLLESPTGTGKTLCLLSAVLAWRESFEKEIQELKELGLEHSTTVDTDRKLPLKLPKIFYASRTHSQLSQAVKELSRTKLYNVKVRVLASREQMCLNERVLNSKGSSIGSLCRIQTSKRQCEFHANLEGILNSSNKR